MSRVALMMMVVAAGVHLAGEITGEGTEMRTAHHTCGLKPELPQYQHAYLISIESCDQHMGLQRGQIHS